MIRHRGKGKNMTDPGKGKKLVCSEDIFNVDNLVAQAEKHTVKLGKVHTNRSTGPGKPYSRSIKVSGRTYWQIVRMGRKADGSRKVEIIKHCGVQQPTKKEVESYAK